MSRIYPSPRVYRTRSFSIIDKTGKEFPGTFTSGCHFVITGIMIRLSQLMTSSDISYQSIISIFDTDGRFLTKGNWYEDRILGYAGRKGIARKIGSGLGISFNLK